MIIRNIDLANLALLVRTPYFLARRTFSTAIPHSVIVRKVMGSTSKTYMNHEERTAAEPREHGMHSVILDTVFQISRTVRLLNLRRPSGGAQIEARNSTSSPKSPLTSNIYSVVPSRPMARRTHPTCSSSRRLHNHVYTSGS